MFRKTGELNPSYLTVAFVMRETRGFLYLIELKDDHKLKDEFVLSIYLI